VRAPCPAACSERCRDRNATAALTRLPAATFLSGTREDGLRSRVLLLQVE